MKLKAISTSWILGLVSSLAFAGDGGTATPDAGSVIRADAGMSDAGTSEEVVDLCHFNFMGSPEISSFEVIRSGDSLSGFLLIGQEGHVRGHRLLIGWGIQNCIEPPQ